ncbi:MAG TPA: zinc ribbon domain-containing protein YjdM [Acidimicrobiales bacterium]
METTTVCPICTMHDIVAHDDHVECMTCGHEWVAGAEESGVVGDVRDAHGTLLHDGDSVVLVKDLKLNGSSDTLKVGTKVTKIRLVSGDHEVDCKIGGRGVLLKAKFLKKA